MDKTKIIDQVFKVPNDEQGRFFIAMCKQYLSSGLTIKVRGRHPNRKKMKKQGINNRLLYSVPQAVADELGIYLQCNGFTVGAGSSKYLREQTHKLYQLQSQVSNAALDLAVISRQLAGGTQ